jgi:hypothetical protein
MWWFHYNQKVMQVVESFTLEAPVAASSFASFSQFSPLTNRTANSYTYSNG